MAPLVAATLVLGLFIAVESASLPVVSDCEDDGLWKSGSSYRYAYTAIVTGKAVGTTDKKTGVQITCSVDLAVLGQCRYILKTPDCGLSEISAPGTQASYKKHPRSSEFKDQMKQYPVSFLMTKGEIRGIISNENEPVMVLNLKRGIISALLVKRTSTPEDDEEMRTDVHGTCPVIYTVSDNHVELVKDMSKCRYPSRTDFHLSPYSLSWNLSFIQFWMMNATIHCSYDLASDHVSKVECHERHAIRLESRHNTAAAVQTVVTQTLEFKNAKGDKSGFDRNLKNKKVKDIPYEWEHVPEPKQVPAEFLVQANKILTDMVDTTKSEMKVFVIPMFSHLVSLLRTSSDVTQFTKTAFLCQFKPGCNDLEKELAQSYMRDALVTCNTAACMKALSWVVTNKFMSNNYFNVMLYSFTKLKVSQPEYLEAVLGMCKARPTRMCLLSLTSMIHSYAVRHSAHHHHHHQPASVKETVQFLSSMLGNDCSPSSALPDLDHYQRIERIILALKSIGNLGDCAQHASGTITRVLNSCINNKNVPHNVTLEAIKAFRRMTFNNQMYGYLMNVVKNQQQSMEHRITAYLVLIKNYQEKNLLEDFVPILKNEKTQQLGNFITMHLNNILIYGGPHLEKLQSNIRTVMADHEDVFVVQGTRPLTSSRHREFARFYNSPLFHDAISRFGIDVSSSAMYESFSYLPQHLILNVSAQLFSKYFSPLLTVSGGFHGFEPVLETLFGNLGLLRKRGDLKELMEDIKQHGINELLKRLHDPVGTTDKTWTPHFDDKIEKRLDDIHNSVFNSYGSESPFGSVSLQLYGDELAFTSLDLIKTKIVDLMEKVHEIVWEEPFIYRAHRIIRFLEGSNQVPTSVGLPLYWQSDATLGLSIRAEVKTDLLTLMHLDPYIDAEWHIHPSGALTVLNRMRVEVPHFTQFGFQANNTIYRSRERSGTLAYKSGDLKINIKVPDNPQQIINLFRTNEIIRGNSLEDIPDYELQRVDTEGCHPDQYTGLKYCRKKSYADVFGQEGKPSILLSGNAEYRVWYEKEDKGLKEYKLHLNVDKSQAPLRVTTIEFEAPGSKWKRQVKGVVKRNLETKEFDVQISVPERPHFRFSASRKLTKEGDKTKYTTHVDAMIFEGRPVMFHGESFTTTETRPSKIDRSMIVTNIKQTTAKLILKHRSYSWERKFQESARERTYDHHFVFESDSTDNYMHDILPDVFWDSDTKASLKFHLGIQKHTLPNEGWERFIAAHVELPKSILELSTHHLEQEAEHHIIHFNLTKKSLPSRELQSFIIFNYDMENNVQGDQTKRTHIAKLMIPRVRWTLNINRDIDPVDNKNTAILTREKARDNSLLITDSSDVSAWHVTLKINHHNDSRARGDVYPAPRERHLDIALTYPKDGEYNTLSYKGKIVNDEGQKNAIRSFQTDSHIESTRFKIKIHGKTNYLRTHEQLSAHHTSDITYIPSGKTANYKFDLDAKYGKSLTLVQKFTSSFYTFDENLVATRDGDKTDGKLTIKAHSPTWDALNVELEQTLHLDPEDSHEEMHFKHKFLDIDVKAEFKLPFGRYYKKEFHIKSKNSIIPSMNWYLFHHDYKYYSARIEYPQDGRNIYAVLEIDANNKGGHLIVSHDSQGHENSTVLDYLVRIIKPNLVLINATTDAKALKRIGQVYAERYAKAYEAWNAIKSDPNHPMNEFLRPIVKTTLADFQRELRERIQQRRLAVRTAIIEAVQSLEPIYGPTLKVLKGIVLSVERLMLHVLNRDRPQSVIVWAWHHFNMPERIRGAAKRFAERAVARLSTWSSSTSSGGIVISHPFKWNHITELPRPSPYLMRRLQRLRKARQILLGKAKPEFRRTAALYGGRHIYTFDGQGYDFPGFAHKECTYLLAHDFVFRRYSLLGQENTIHVLFPEIAISVNKQGMVGINGTKLNQRPPVSSYNDRVHLKVDGDSMILTSDYGLNAVFMKEGVALISLDFWNHNRTLGLLGNNDNEMKNDMKLLSGKISDSEFDFIANYDVSERSECKNRKKLQNLKKACTQVEDGSCSNLFDENNSQSPLYPCFDIVPPKSFRSSCVTDSKCGNSICNSIAAYVNVCIANDVYIQKPDSCHK